LSGVVEGCRRCHPWLWLSCHPNMDARIDAKVSVEALALSCSSVNSELNTPSTASFSDGLAMIWCWRVY
jgi:hypothetical protein